MAIANRKVIEAALESFWRYQVEVAEQLGKIAITTDPMAVQMHLDSQIAVEVLCELDPLIGFKLKDDAIRKGGYTSFDEFRTYTLTRLESLSQKHAKKSAAANA